MKNIRCNITNNRDTLIDLYGINGYKSNMQTMMKECKKSEKEITGNYELFANRIHSILGKYEDSKIIDPIKIEINRIKIIEANEINRIKKFKI